MGAFFSQVPFPGFAKEFRNRSGVFSPEGLWFASLLLLIFPVYLGHFDLSGIPLAKYAVYSAAIAAYLLLLLKITFWDGNSIGQLIIMACVLFLLCVGCVFSGSRCYLNTFLLIFAAKGIPLRKISRFFFGFFLATTVFNFLLLAAGVVEDTILIRGEAIGNGNVRHGLGFGHPNSLGFWAMMVIFSGLMVCENRKQRWIPPALLVFSVAVFLASDSKASFGASLLALLLYAAIQFRENRLNTLKRAPELAAGAIVLIVVGYTVLSLLYRPDQAFFRLANAVLSERLVTSHNALKTFGISLFGSRPDFRWDPVDCLFTYAPICLGMIPSLLYFALALWSMYRAAKHRQWVTVAVHLAAAIYCTMEYSLINPIHIPLFAATARLTEPQQN